MFKPALHKPHLSLQNTLFGVESQSTYKPSCAEWGPASPSKGDWEGPR